MRCVFQPGRMLLLGSYPMDTDAVHYLNMLLSRPW